MLRSVRHKLVANALLALGITLLVGMVGYAGLYRVHGSVEQVMTNGKALRAQMTADMMHDALRADVYAALHAGPEAPGEQKRRLQEAVKQHGAQLTASLEEAVRASNDMRLDAILGELRPELKRYTGAADELVSLALTNDYVGAMQKLPAFLAAFERLEKEMKDVSDMIEADSARSQKAGEGTMQVSRALIVAACLIATALLLVISYLLARAIVVPLDQAVRVARAVAAGDLTVEVRTRRTDELGELLRALAKMKDDLAESVRSIQLAAEAVKSGSSEIARGNADLSGRTEEQASSLEETAASMEEITTTVKRNAENAREANRLALDASEVAQRGGEAVREVVATMGGIADASKRIAEIISLIDGIAFQTNILALNAAVEAARAGEQGRGFAVVASEVRALAQRSAEAARQITDLIQDSVGRVAEGTRQAGGAGRTMDEIVDSVKRVHQFVSEISVASDEQLRGIEQVGQAIMQMDQVVQQNAALVEESAAAAENLEQQAEALAALAVRFKVQGGQAVPAPAQPARQEPRLVPPGAAPYGA